MKSRNKLSKTSELGRKWALNILAFQKKKYLIKDGNQKIGDYKKL